MCHHVETVIDKKNLFLIIGMLGATFGLAMICEIGWFVLRKVMFRKMSKL